MLETNLMQYIIVQAGGRGSRLETLTTNKPKALVPVDNLPMIFHLFNQYPDAKFKIIADYHKDTFKRYLRAFAKVDYDWAKLYYSVVGNYDQFNRKNFSLEVKEKEVDLMIVSNNWEELEDYFFEITQTDRKKIKLLHTIIWLSLTTYAWEDYDAICGAFYKGLLELQEYLDYVE